MKKKGLIILGIIFAIIVAAIVSILIWYNSSIKAINKEENAKEIEVEITSGTSTKNIVKKLKENNLIKNKLATEIYIKLNNVKSLKAGKYTLNNSMSVKEILENISSGKITKEEINITFLEGKNIRWIASKIASETNNSEDDVYELLEDDEYINSLIDEYWFLNETILDKDIYYPLEGYLYPDTYTFKNKDVTVKEIFKDLLDQTDKVLSKHKEEIGTKSVHKILTFASIIELEGKNEEDRKGIARVFYNRISKNMPLGSDVTTYYGIKVDMGERNLTSKEINTSNPYNTRGPNMNGKLPIGPIANVSEESIEATLNPANSDNLYFVADSKGKIYFAKDYEGHQENIKNLKSKGLWYSYE